MKPFNYFFSNNIILESNEGAAGEAESHLTHLEDLAIEEGKKGFIKFIDQVDNFTAFLEGLDSKTNVNLKIDGSPALFFGLDPRKEYKNAFFISTKSVFSKNPNLIHDITEVDILYKDAPQGLKDVLKSVFPLFKAGYDNSGYMYQGDLLYTPSRPPIEKNIDGVNYLTFQPNLITYAVPVDPKSKIYNNVLKSKAGIIIHAKFDITPSADGIITKMAGRDVSNVVDSLQKAGVFTESGNYKTLNVRLDIATKNKLNNLLNDAKNKISQIDDDFDRQYLSQPTEVNAAGKLVSKPNIISKNYLLQQYLNYMVREGGGIFKAAANNERFNPEKFQKGFVAFYNSKIDKAAEGKGERARQNSITKKQSLISFLNENENSFNSLLEVTYIMYVTKSLFLNLLKQATHQLDSMKGFIPVGDKYITQGEGHVLYVGNTSNQVKIVDRLSFSANNFLFSGNRGRAGTVPPKEDEENKIYTIGFFGGGFNPPHIGHYEAAKIAAKVNDDVYIIISQEIREDSGITPDIKQNIWNIYKPQLEKFKAKIHIILADVSPVRTVYEYVSQLNDSPDASHISVNLYTDIDDVNRYDRMDKYSNNLHSLNIKHTPRIGSGTTLRADIKSRNKQRVYNSLPTDVDKDAVWNILTSI